MNLMKKFMKKREGFTLVELIVVIAILAILAGVAVPAYSAYVTKANKQADMTLVSDVLYAVQTAHYTTPLDGAVTIVLQGDEGVLEIVGDTDSAKSWAHTALENAFGGGYSSALQLKYDGWGNGVAVANVMLTALQDGGDVEAAMEKIYGDAGSLSFTEEIPVLMDEVKSIALEIGGDDELAIGIVTSAANITADWTVDSIQMLWKNNVEYNGSAYVGVDDYVASASSAFDKKLTIAGVLRAKNTCLALYASQNGYLQYYDKLSSFSVSDTSIVPYDLTRAAMDGSPEQARLCTVLGLDPTNSADLTTLGDLATLLGNYYTATDSDGDLVFKNDAAAYAAMMGIVDGLATSDDSPLNTKDLDEYFNAVSGPVSLFQQLVTGAADITNLTTALGSLTTTGSNISITLIPDGYDLEVVVGPTNAKS